MSSVIRCSGLVKRFRDVHALDGLDLEVPEGEVFAFLGPNGAGKTTALRILLGLLRPDEGEATVFGLDASRDALKIRRRLGVLLEHDGLYERLSAQANLELWGRLYGMPRSRLRPRVRLLLQEMGLFERRRDRVHGLSRGMRRKLAVARALVPEPELLVLDEPTTGLDPHAVVDLRRRLVGLARDEGTTVLLTTHNLHEAGRLARRVGVIARGRLVECGSPKELAERHGASHVVVTGSGLDAHVVEEVLTERGVLGALSQGFADTLRLRVKRGASFAPVLERIIEAGGEVESTKRHEEDLEEIFLHLIQDTPGDQSRGQSAAMAEATVQTAPVAPLGEGA